jgi:hypothetical protein
MFLSVLCLSCGFESLNRIQTYDKSITPEYDGLIVSLTVLNQASKLADPLLAHLNLEPGNFVPGEVSSLGLSCHYN